MSIKDYFTKCNITEIIRTLHQHNHFFLFILGSLDISSLLTMSDYVETSHK